LLGSNERKPQIAVVQGPTASGKTELAVRIARRFDGELVNADSLQWVKYFDIGTAKPSASDRAAVQHYLIDSVEPDEHTDVATYLRLARPIIADIQKRGSLPIVEGGTGLYVRALLGGLVELPGRNDALRERFEALLMSEGPEGLFAELERREPHAAQHIDRDNPRRVIRALEVLELTGKPIWSWQREHGFSERPYDAFIIAIRPDMESLQVRVEDRTDYMLKLGLVDEVRDLLNRYPRTLKAFGAIGYAQVLQMIDGEFPESELKARIVTATMQYAKKQLRWLKTEKDVHWIVSGEQDQVLAELGEWVSR
jgi:tRNA dimethylallyltransferase